MNLKPTIHSVALAFSCVLALLSTASAQNASGASGSNETDWASAEPGVWASTQHGYGIVSDAREMQIAPTFAVRITDSKIELGQRVEQGQPLAVISAPIIRDLVDRVASQRQSVKIAARELGDIQTSFEQKIATNQQVLAAQANRTRAESGLQDRWNELGSAIASLGADLERKQIEGLLDTNNTAKVISMLSIVRAPFGGIIMQRGAMPGVTLPVGTVLFSIEDISSVYVDVAVQPDRVDRWNDGTTTARIMGTDLTLEHLNAMPRLDPETSMVLLRFRASLPGDLQIDGATLKVTHRSMEEPIVFVPASAVVARKGETWCLIEDASGSPTPVRVTVGPTENNRVVVFSGLEPSQRVLIHNAYETLYQDLNTLVIFQD